MIEVEWEGDSGRYAPFVPSHSEEHALTSIKGNGLEQTGNF